MAFIDKINPDVPEGRLLIRNGNMFSKILKAISQIESTSLRGISAKWKGNAKLEDFIK